MVTKKTNVAPESPPTAVPTTPAAPAASSAAAGGITAPATPTAAPATAQPAFSLDAPLRWKTANPAEQKVLENLQGNILKGHGRDHTANIFFRFGSDKLKSKRVLREIGNFYVTSAYKQLLGTEAFKTSQVDGGTFYAAFVSAAGYQKLGLAFAAPAGNTAFGPGMKSGQSLADLGDKLADWESGFTGGIDGMILVADDDTARGDAAVQKMQALLTDAGCTLVHTQKGKAIRNAIGNGLEHFGYVDGRSQPLMLVEDIEAESRDEGIAHWDPTAALSKALVRDPLAQDSAGLAFGSFFIFRKLEEKVRGFKTKEQELADALQLTGEARELAGALLVGRFEDGTPVTMSDRPRGVKSPANDFSYDGDAGGARCPFHAHIRKTNPRGSGGFGQSLAAEQAHIMARRGITYEDTPRVHPDDLPEAESKAEFMAEVAPLLPEGGLGLLFMAYNARLDDQFVFTQKSWANSSGFPQVPATTPPRPPGIDGTIGQPPDANGQHHYFKQWDDGSAPSVSFKGFNGFVTMRGGEYFFAPSLHFLRNL